VQIFDDRRLQAITALGPFVDLDPGQALGTINFYELGIAINFATANRCAARDPQARNSALGIIGGIREHLEVHRLHDIGQFGELKLDPQVRLIGSETLHGLGIRHHRECIRQCDLNGGLKDMTNHALKEITDLLLCEK